MYLVDTNVWLELLLGQAKANDVADFLDKIPAQQLYLTDFAFHSICVILTRLRKETALANFVQDLFVDGEVSLATLAPEETPDLLAIKGKFHLDFDDAYQYAAAGKYGLTLVSFDADFNRTKRGKQTPREILDKM